MMTSSRRSFLKRSLAGGAVVAAASAGLLVPSRVLAAWPEASFKAKSVDEALADLLGGSDAVESGDITIKAPDIAENGAVVPVTVSTSMSKVESITIIVEANGTPLSASFNLAANTVPEISTRLKMGKTSNVVAMIKADGKLYKAAKQVKVTIGGCGG